MTLSYQWTEKAEDFLRRNYHKYTGERLVGMVPLDMKGNRPTRNAIIGKAQRLGLSKPFCNPSVSGYFAKSYKPRQPEKEKGKEESAMPSVPTPLPKPFVPPVSLDAFNASIPRQQMVNLMQLTTHTCRWPLGKPFAQPPFFYCGDEPLDGLPYCRGHAYFAFGHARSAA